jgi:diguanylate cyclase (GGDEF)-like protein
MRNSNSGCSSAALLIVDLDKFHTINESLGYSNGDKALVNCAELLRCLSSSPDDIARLGKDEFALFLPCTAPSFDVAAAEAEQLAAKVIQKLEIPVFLEGKAHQLGACIGITLFHCPNEASADELIRQADIALKMAKSSNTANISFFDQQMEQAVKKRMETSQALNQAIERDQLTLAFQPQVDARHEIIGFEALLRWSHPDLGTVSPNDFIPIAEATGSIINIGDWVLEESCKKLVRWGKQKSSERLQISINVSSVQFRRTDFIRRVQDILEKTGANPKRLRFELTESIIAEDIDFIVEQMEKLQELGVTLSLDDFGTGYASLAYLTRLPLDELKVDRVFVSDLDAKNKGVLLTETIISLGRSMNLSVIAEGVETEQQFKRLQDMGCQYFQGYLFGKPTTDVESYLSSE